MQAMLCSPLPLCMLASAVSLVLRYRRSGGEVRQQIKWIAFAASFVCLMYMVVIGGAQSSGSSSHRSE